MTAVRIRPVSLTWPHFCLFSQIQEARSLRSVQLICYSSHAGVRSPSTDTVTTPPTVRKHLFSQSRVRPSASLRPWKKFCYFPLQGGKRGRADGCFKTNLPDISIARDSKWRENTTGAQNNQEKCSQTSVRVALFLQLRQHQTGCLSEPHSFQLEQESILCAKQSHN